MKSKTSPIQRKYHLFDGSQFILGRLSTKAAFILQGKNKPSYAPNKDEGDFVVILNSDKARFTGGKEDKKMYHLFSGYPGGITSRKLKQVMERDSKKVVSDSVYGMLPKNKLREKMMKRLLVFKDDQHDLKVKFEENK